MASGVSSNLRLEMLVQGEGANTWGTSTNNNLKILERSISGYEDVAVTSPTTTLTSTDWALDTWLTMVMRFTGTLTANTNVVVPAFDKMWIAENATGGAFTLTVKTSAGTGVAIPAGQRAILLGDGTNVTGTVLQPYDPELAAFAAISTNGLVARTGAGTGAARTVTGTANQITVTNGDGVSGNPTLSLPSAVTVPGSLTVTNALTVSAGGAAITGDATATGAVGVGTTSLTGYRVRIQGNLTGATGTQGLSVQPTVQSDVTSAASIVVSQPATAAAVFTLANLRHFFASQGTLGAGSAVTSQFGFMVDSTLTGATNNYGFYSNIGTGTGRYNFYAAGSADNYFNGPVAISGINRFTMGTDPGTIGASAQNPPRVTVNGTSAGANSNVALVNTSSGGQVAGELWHAKSLAAGGTPTVTNGVLLGAQRFFGHDSAAYGESAAILVQADAAMAAGSTPGRMMFHTTPSGAAVSVERLRIDSAGNVGIGTGSPTYKLQVAGTFRCDSGVAEAGNWQVGSSGGTYRIFRYDGYISSDGSTFYPLLTDQSTLAVAKLSGTIADANMQTRLHGYALNIGDWNDARANGWYMADSATNAPVASGWYIGNVEAHNDIWVTQTVHGFTASGVSDTAAWRRHRQSGTWTAWYRLRLSETEQSALYLNASNLNAGTVPAARLSGSYDISVSGAAATFRGGGGTAGAPTFSFTSDTDTGVRLSNTNELALVTGGADRVTVDGSGNVGVGMAPLVVADSRMLTVKGASTGLGWAALRVQSGSSTKMGTFQIGGANATVVVGTDSANTTGSLELWAGGALRTTIDTSGNVGIGVAPVSTADCRTVLTKGAATGAGYAILALECGINTKQAVFQINGADGNIDIGTAAGNTTGNLALFAGGAVRATVHSDGSLRHGQSGTATPGYSAEGSVLGAGLWASGRLFIGQDAFSNWNQTAGGPMVGFSLVGVGKGAINIDAAGVYYTSSSDYRLKQDVEPLTGALARLLGLRPSRFRFRSDPEAPLRDGFLAHEVAGVVPEAVQGEKDAIDAEGDPVWQTLEQSRLVPLLVAALQETLVRIETLERRIG